MVTRMNPNEKWYSVKEFAAIYGVHPDSVRRRIKAGKIKALRWPKVSPKKNRVYEMEQISETERQRFERGNMTS